MTPQLQPGVERRLESPTEGATVTLLIGVREDTEEATAEQISHIGGDVEEILPYNTLAVSIDETSLSELCAIETVETVEIEGTWEAADDPNFRSPESSTP
ncbi:hypothetical protein [Halobacterium noricense]|uniref:hypothetical protein n=1 Tax=Halobacterium noricense TaxID=223182 RepID=UPI001E5FE3D7|nr:hypothetical protein [Halobacterium noricense]UHH26470.1 hypothetical protein LT974_05910 [Halobacterium noricense]